MPPEIAHILQSNTILSHTNTGVTVCTVQDSEAGIALAKDLLYDIVHSQTALYLSGGRTPQTLYEQFAIEEQLVPGAVGMVDERFGEKFHAKSNEKMIRETDFLQYLETSNIPFYPILQEGMDPAATAAAYDETERMLHATFKKSVGLLGVGTDGHTSGLPALNSKLEIQNAKSLYVTNDFVTSYDDTTNHYGERVTTTFLGLSMMDLLIVIAFGKDKQEALNKMFEEGSEEEIPARFYTRPEISSKTILITDQDA